LRVRKEKKNTEEQKKNTAAIHEQDDDVYWATQFIARAASISYSTHHYLGVHEGQAVKRALIEQTRKKVEDESKWERPLSLHTFSPFKINILFFS
jgi:hypothetical protein